MNLLLTTSRASAYFSIQGLELDGDFLSLGVGPRAQDVDDGLLIRPEALHRLAQDLGVGLRVEGIGRYHRWAALNEKGKSAFYWKLLI